MSNTNMNTKRFPINKDADLDVLCHRWNELTNPAEMRSTEEHNYCNNAATLVFAAIQARFTIGVHYEQSAMAYDRLIPLRGYRDKPEAARPAYHASDDADTRRNHEAIQARLRW